MSYGITSAGFVIKPLQVIKNELETEFKNRFGESLDVSAESVAGQIIGNTALKLANIWELAAAVYASFNPDSAEDAAQDGVCAMVGVVRNQHTKTLVWVILYGAQGTSISAGHLVSSSHGYIFSLETATTISASNAIDITVNIPSNVVDGQTYSISIDGINHSYVAANEESKADVLIALKTGIENDINGESFTFSIDGDQLRIYRTDGFTSFSVIISTNLSFVIIGTPGRYLAEEYGAIPVPANSVNQIVQQVSGLDYVNNMIDGSIGSETESNDALRIRRRNSLFIRGYSAEKAIQARILQEVNSVSYCAVISNRTDTADADGRPPHSAEIVVMGGDIYDIAEKLWEVFPAGITFHGDISVTIQDSMGQDQIIKFSRPRFKYIWIRIEIELSDEESFPTSGMDQIKSNIVNWADENIVVGTDVVWQKLFRPIYQVTGISSAVITLGSSDEENVQPAYGTANIEISPSELARFDASRIEVEIV